MVAARDGRAQLQWPDGLERADLGVFHLFLSVWWLFLRVLLVYV